MNKKMNVYYYGEDRGHCGSCRERSDEDVKVLITTLTLEEMIEKLQDYCYIWVEEKFSYTEFLERTSSNGDDGDDLIHYPTILFDVSGTSYCPEFHYSSNAIGESYDVEECLNPSKIMKDWGELQVKWKKNIADNIKREEDRLAKKEKEKKKKKKIEDNQKEYDEYLDLSKKWDGKDSPDDYIPTKEDLKNLDKFLNEFKDKKDQFERYKKLKKKWKGKERPADYPKEELKGFAKFLEEYKMNLVKKEEKCS